MMKPTLLIDDRDILVCVKPAGMLSQSAEGKGGVTVQDEFPDIKLYPVHRLDRETAGVMVFAKNPKAAAELSKQIEQNKLVKRYFAVVKGAPDKKEGVLEDLLFRDKQKNKSYVVKRIRKGVRQASLEYKVLDEKEGMSLLEILLHTGRTHQIRVQFSSRGLPLYGDGRYGGGTGDLALFAHSLSFTHPTTKEQITQAAMPDFEKAPWNLFRKESCEALASEEI